jgi:hypothetical protein
MLMRDISDIEKKRRDAKKELYKKIFEQFTRKIKSCVELNQKQVFLQVPAFLFGFPTFDRTKATDYLRRQLIRSGFDVSTVNDFELYVSWYKKKAQSEPEKESELPTLANLHKLARKYTAAPRGR